MNPLVDITVSLFFEVKDSKVYGGADSVGYASSQFGSVRNLDAVDDGFIARQIEIMARTTGVPAENIKLISKEEHDRETEPDDEGEDDDYDEEEEY